MRAQVASLAKERSASRPSQHRLSLTQLVFALPELRSLDVRKAPKGPRSKQGDLWTPACYSCLAEITRAMHKGSPWCSLEAFMCDPIPAGA